MSAVAPWMRIYTRELLADPKIRQMSHDQLGKLLILWASANEDGGCLPSDPEAIGRLIGIPNPNQMVNHLVWIRRFFSPLDGDPTRLISLRLAAEQQAYAIKCEKLRANGYKGGRPASEKPNGYPNGYPEGYPNGYPKNNQMCPEDRSTEKEKESTTPLTPLGGIEPVVEAKRKRKRQAERLQGYRPEVVALVQRLLAQWPTSRDKKPIRHDLVDAVGAVEDLLNAHPEVTLDLLEAAALDWLQDPGDYPNAIQFWFGPGKAGKTPPWARAVKAEIYRRTNNPQPLPLDEVTA